MARASIKYPVIRWSNVLHLMHTRNTECSVSGEADTADQLGVLGSAQRGRVPGPAPLVPPSSHGNGQHKAAPPRAARPRLSAALQSSSSHYRNKEPAAHFSEGQTRQTFSCSPSFAGATPAASGTAPRHPKTAGFGSRLPAEPALQPEHEQNTLQCLQRFPNASHALPHGVAPGARTPSCLGTSFASHPSVRIPICGRNKGREWLAAPFCISCFPLSALTSDVRCHILYFM